MEFLSSCTSGGCGAKIGPDDLSVILKKLPVFSSDQLLVGYDTSDDAAVYLLKDDEAIVATMDFFSPMVEDPRSFGRIAAANALSDVYAMGAEVLFALNIVCFPEKMDKSILGEILQGGAEKLKEAGGLLCGGHSIYDKEPKYGLSVTGRAHPKHIIRNNTCKIGDQLILTKPLGVGIIMAAHRVEMASADAVSKAVYSMERLNKYAAEKMKSYHVHACTDITGFGLLAHLDEMADKTHTIELRVKDLPYFKEAYDYANDYLLTAAGQRNRNHMKDQVNVEELDFAIQELLFDPQTSGGLMISVAKDQAQSLLKEIKEVEPNASIIGEVRERQEHSIIFS
ncbi:MAG TPA: selenide, water dikinase SelD [Candidatus Merdenecus merdavium]|nr:selenide, water dikinase SelD [Candidatus Merdenecus merdavium]